MKQSGRKHKLRLGHTNSRTTQHGRVLDLLFCIFPVKRPFLLQTPSRNAAHR